MPDFDLIVIGAGPGGYVAAIKAAQHGKKVALVEREALGGVCLNWGCIPTKALLKAAEVFELTKHASAFGINAGTPTVDFPKTIAYSRGIADQMSKGVAFLMKKNKVMVLTGTARLAAKDQVVVKHADGEKTYSTGAIILATGARPRAFPHLPIDGTLVFNAREAMNLPKQPKSLLCIGAGAIGMEFASFYAAIGTTVTVVEMMDQVLPIEDVEVSKFVEKAFVKKGVAIKTGTKVAALTKQADSVTVVLDKGGVTESLTVDRVLVAVGMVPNVEGLGLEAVGVKLGERGFVATDENAQTNIPGIYAIGDLAGRQLLAHKASVEGEAAVAHMVGHPNPVDYTQVPGCTYCQPQVASLGLTEAKATANGRQVKIGRFQFMASGKAQAINHPEGFVKLIFDAQHNQLIGAHLVGYDATEMLAELSLAMKIECTAEELVSTIHAHPTLSEAVMEAAADALGQCVHQ